MAKPPRSQSAKSATSQKKKAIAPKRRATRAPRDPLTSSPAPSRWRSLKVWATRLTVVLGLAWVLGYLPLQFFGERGLQQYRRLRRELVQLQERNQKLAEEIRHMKLEVQRLRDDDAALEKAAREDLGMVRRGELVFVVKE